MECGKHQRGGKMFSLDIIQRGFLKMCSELLPIWRLFTNVEFLAGNE
jgi:hypothetical protein